MDEVRKKAYALRRKGYSYNEINRELGVSKSTLSSWFSRLTLSQKAQQRLQKRKTLGTDALIKRNKQQTHDARCRAKKIQRTAQAEVPKFSKEHLALIGIALYWAEGYKRPLVRNGREVTSHIISFVNSDPDMIRIFIRFLNELLDVPAEKIRLVMRLYPHIDEAVARRYWKKATGLPDSCFYLTTYLVTGASKGHRPYNRLPHGTLQVAVHDTAAFHRLIGMIEGMKKNF